MTKKRVAILATVLNGIVAIFKITIGLLYGSMAIFADGIDSLTDIFTSITMLISIHIASKPPDREHPYGHERAEAIGAKIISFVIFYAGVSLMVESIKRIFSGEYHTINGWLPLGIMLLSIIVKTGIFSMEYYVGKKEHSRAMLSEAMNMRNDIFRNIAILVGIYLTKFGIPILDPLLGLILSLFIIKTAFDIFRDSVYELMEGLPPEEMEIYDKISEAIANCRQIKGISKIMVRKMGKWYLTDIHVLVNGEKTINEMHFIRNKIVEYIKKQTDNIRDINIIVYPEKPTELNISCGGNDGKKKH